jgi:hypothetical protein
MIYMNGSTGGYNQLPLGRLQVEKNEYSIIEYVLSVDLRLAFPLPSVRSVLDSTERCTEHIPPWKQIKNAISISTGRLLSIR